MLGTIKSNGEDAIDLASLLANSERRVDPNTWTSICNGLSIASNVDSKISSADKPVQSDDAKLPAKQKWRRERLIRNGYALVDDTFDVGLVREGIEALNHKKIPATFVLLFDETWQLARQSKKVLEEASHERNIFNYDLLAWYIPPGSPGFSPHRDRQPENSSATFHSDDQQAKFVTNWIALSDATPENSCLYVIPKPYDPGYTTGDMDSVDDEGENHGSSSADPLHRALYTKEAFQHIRCLPRKAGQSVLFTHRIIHWGSQGDPLDDDDEKESGHSETTVSPRIAISFVASDPDYEAPLLVNHAKCFSNDRFPPLHIRLLLVCAQLLIYYQRFELDKSVIKACYEYCKQHQDELEESYRRKVFVEFVKAMKEQNETINTKIETETNNAETTSAADAAAAAQTNDDEDDDNDDDEDAMLEEMLNAEAGGYGEFEDDYDDLEEGDDYNEDGGDHDDEEEEEENVDLFGTKRKSEDPESSAPKKAKMTFIT